VKTSTTILSRIAADPGKLALAIAFGLALGYLGGLFRLSMSHDLILDPRGRPVLSDFVAFWTAGHQALKGAAAATYDARLEHAAELTTIGHASRDDLGWSYPPVFLFGAAFLASLPYALSFILWGCGTLALHASTVAAIARKRVAVLFACASPWVLTGLMSGQNGFLTASLIAMALMCTERRPALSGILLGLLSYKPQFGILFPLALAAGGYWRVFAYAAASTLAFNGLACAVFGIGTLNGFLHALAGAAQSHLAVNGLGWNKLESLYGLLRALGVPSAAAWIADAALIVMTVVAIAVLWRSRAPFALKAAGLAAAVPMATPYVLVYDLTVLTVAGAFLFRQREFDHFELSVLASILPCVLLVYVMPVPTAFLATAAMSTLVVRRALAQGVAAPQLPPVLVQYSSRI